MESLSELVETWLKWDKDDATRDEIVQLRDAGNEDELEKRLRKRIQFGTAGLRGRMQAGFSSINCLTVIQASQGLAKYVQAANQDVVAKANSTTATTPLVIIGHDARYNSAKYARLAANAFLALGIRVLMFSTPSPTPFVPFFVLKKKAAAGVMVTASHNPAKDNGYKVYLANGAQINSPADSQIATSIEESLTPWESAWADPESHELFQYERFEEAVDEYCRTVEDYLRSSLGVETLTPSPLVYTPLHGVGGKTFFHLCERLGVEDVAVVDEQIEPNPDFPTVPFPNPEEAGALDLAMRKANSTGGKLVFANDPDADRFAVAEKYGRKWHKFSGDQIGILLASFILESSKDIPPGKKKGILLTTAVSSAMLLKLASINGYDFHETLTGFKWLANETQRLEGNQYYVPFAYEEALGYMLPGICYDKDGLSAAMTFMAAETKWRSEGLTPYSKLLQLYRVCGHHQSLNTYLISPDKEVTRKLFESIREKKSLTFPVARIRDMTVGSDSGTLDGLPTLPPDAGSQMITIWTLTGVRMTIRASGTEPKVKLYIESNASNSENASKNVSQTFLTVLNDWIAPYAPSMTYSHRQTTSSGHSFTIPAGTVKGHQ